MESLPFDTPAGKQLASWTLRLASDDMFGYVLMADPHLFAMTFAACATAVEPPAAFDVTPSAKGALASDKLLTTLKDLQRQFGERTSGKFAKLYLTAITLYDSMGGDRDKLERGLKEWQETAEREANAFISSQEENLDRLAELIDLDKDEQKLLSFQLNRQAPGFSQLFELLMMSSETTTFLLGQLLDISWSKVTTLISEESTLVKSGLLAVQERPLMIEAPSPHLRATLTDVANSEEEFIRRFVRPLEPVPTTGSLARLHDHDRDVLLKLLRLDVPEDHGLHSLVYGPKSIDKRDMLARLFESEHIPAYAVQTKNVPPSDLPAWVYIAQRHLEQDDPNAVLVVDRAEQALASKRLSLMSLFGFEDDSGPSEDEDRASDEGLTASKVRCVWLTDRGGALSEKNLGRFLFHCEVLPGSRADRRSRIQQVITEFELSPDLEGHLSKYSLLGEQQVRQAARLAELVGDHDEHKEQVIKRAVHQSQRVLGRDKTESLRESVTQYSLDLLNISGKFTPEQIIKALRERPHGTLCFYGLPGSGKTQLAEYMAVELDLPILMKSASDLLSKWLGESEQNIAAMFAEAEAEGALLFLDECDSFLRDRSLARAEWSVTQVNELLQKLERAPGVVIMATNLMRDIDAAALRRFTWKLEFKALKPEQSWKMFCNEVGFDPDKQSPAEVEDLQKRLWAIKNLAPGDFATVQRQARLLGESLTTDEWIEQLAAESKAKMLGIERHGVGFGADVS